MIHSYLDMLSLKLLWDTHVDLEEILTRICRIRMGKARNGTLRKTNAEGMGRG